MTDTKTLTGADVLRALADGKKIAGLNWTDGNHIYLSGDRLVHSLGGPPHRDHIADCMEGATIYTPPPKRYRLADGVEVTTGDAISGDWAMIDGKSVDGEHAFYEIPKAWLVEMEGEAETRGP